MFKCFLGAALGLALLSASAQAIVQGKEATRQSLDGKIILNKQGLPIFIDSDGDRYVVAKKFHELVRAREGEAITLKGSAKRTKDGKMNFLVYVGKIHKR